jgi:hypothetical protein
MNCLSSTWGWVLLIAAIPGIGVTLMFGTLFWRAGEVLLEDWKKR